MTMYATLEEAIDAAREEFLADHPGLEQDEANVQQFNVQKYVLAGWGHHVAGRIFRR
ncbi:acidic protein MsyB [Salmonella enterica subsp. enterica]|nr:acidic protein MsyB [Salmonella enterica subsp. enterica]